MSSDEPESSAHTDVRPPLDGTRPDEAALHARLRAIFPNGVPNIYRMMLRNPRVMAGLVAMKECLAGGELTEAERCLVALEVANYCECSYCIVALSHYSVHDLGVPDAVVDAAAKGALPGEARLDLVIGATRALLASRGKLGRAELARYRERGLSFAQILEIIGVIGEYTVATFSANLDRTRIDPEYRLG
ncbi:alkylhydroperoxidase [Rhodovulum sp. 12E13]|uniref:carboxymuconolactone decarboxylase family protein n=1 Tax=Rhodovulum sp. 12E13 TaxID=2203891 RepID=UPI000E15746F|nr:alkylhydroperoxidase [Rhodovulum sp. 12E13]RDC71297.1 alkylhydroperoxidase [Rhodovulum sp. 12E13]